MAEVKRALANKQQFVQLGDGTLGILPEEWLKEIFLVFRVGEGKTNNLSYRYHMSVIDELYENRDEKELVFSWKKNMSRLESLIRYKKLSLPNIYSRSSALPDIRLSMAELFK